MAQARFIIFCMVWWDSNLILLLCKVKQMDDFYVYEKRKKFRWNCCLNIPYWGIWKVTDMELKLKFVGPCYQMKASKRNKHPTICKKT